MTLCTVNLEGSTPPSARALKRVGRRKCEPPRDNFGLAEADVFNAGVEALDAECLTCGTSYAKKVNATTSSREGVRRSVGICQPPKFSRDRRS